MAGLTRIGIGGLAIEDVSATTLGIIVALAVIIRPRRFARFQVLVTVLSSYCIRIFRGALPFLIVMALMCVAIIKRSGMTAAERPVVIRQSPLIQ